MGELIVVTLSLLLSLQITFCYQCNYIDKHKEIWSKMALHEKPENCGIHLKSPAKLNLFLRVTSRYRSGYHQLCSLFQTVSLFDDMSITKLEDSLSHDKMTCSNTLLEVDKTNLVIKALELMRTKTKMKQYFKVHLQKNIPMQAGLGGGSGNAATAMYAFNQLCGYPASIQQMQEWSAELGSDVSFFFSSGTAYCTGRGEEVLSLAPLPDSDNVRVLILQPSEGLSTAQVFQRLQLEECNSRSPLELLSAFQIHGALQAAAQGFLVNDLEVPAFQLMPQLAELKGQAGAQWAGAEGAVKGAMMTGSGSCVFALADTAVVDALDPSLPIPTTRSAEKQYLCRFVQRVATDVHSWY